MPTSWPVPGMRQSQRTGSVRCQPLAQRSSRLRLAAHTRAQRLCPLPPGTGLVCRAARCRLGRPHGPCRRAHGAAALTSRTTPRHPCPGVQAAVAAVQGTGALLFINDHWREAIARRCLRHPPGPGRPGCPHPPKSCRRLRSQRPRLGVSTHGYAEMVRADAVQPQLHRHGRRVPHHAEKNGHRPARAWPGWRPMPSS